MRIIRGQILHVLIQAAGNFMHPVALHARQHEIIRRRNQRRVSLVIEQQPGHAVRFRTENRRREIAVPETKVMQPSGKRGEVRKDLELAGGIPATAIQQHGRLLVINADAAVEHLPGKMDFVKRADPVPDGPVRVSLREVVNRSLII